MKNIPVPSIKFDHFWERQNMSSLNSLYHISIWLPAHVTGERLLGRLLVDPHIFFVNGFFVWYSRGRHCSGCAVRNFPAFINIPGDVITSLGDVRNMSWRGKGNHTYTALHPHPSDRLSIIVSRARARDHILWSWAWTLYILKLQ